MVTIVKIFKPYLGRSLQNRKRWFKNNSIPTMTIDKDAHLAGWNDS